MRVPLVLAYPGPRSLSGTLCDVEGRRSLLAHRAARLATLPDQAPQPFRLLDGHPGPGTHDHT